MTSRVPKFNDLIVRWRTVFLLGLSALLFGWTASIFAAIDEADLLPVDEAFRPELKVEADKLLISFKVAPGYYLYQERIEVQPLRPEEVAIGALN